MTMNDYSVLLFLVCVAALIEMGRRLSMAAQPYRKVLSEKGEFLLSAPTVPAEIKRTIRVFLGEAFGGRMLLIATCVALPIFAFIFAFFPTFWNSIADRRKKLSGENAKMYDEFIRLSNIISFANHPIILACVFVEIAILFTPALIIRTLIKGAIQVPDNFYAINVNLEAYLHDLLPIRLPVRIYRH